MVEARAMRWHTTRNGRAAAAKRAAPPVNETQRDHNGRSEGRANAKRPQQQSGNRHTGGAARERNATELNETQTKRSIGPTNYPEGSRAVLVPNPGSPIGTPHLEFRVREI